jgi:AMP deaminase
MADMRRIFLKTTNYMGGWYFAGLIKLVLSRHKESKGHNLAVEMCLSIYGMECYEWLDLVKWVLNDWEGGDFPGLVLSSHNCWLVQVPCLWRIYRNKPGEIERSFQEMLDNLFVPMFEAMLCPEEHPEVADLLKHIVGIDSVDDEGAHEVSASMLWWAVFSNPF